VQPTYQDTYEEYQETGSRRVGLFVGLGLVVAVSIILVLILRATKPKLVPAPTAFVSFPAPDQSFVVDQPVGWDSTAAGAGAVTSNAVFTSGPAKISIGSDLAGSLWGDMAQAQNNQIENMSSLAGVQAAAPPPPIDKVHMMGEQEVANQYASYAEQPMETIEGKIGEGRISEFTGNGGAFVGPVHGYRATFLSTERRITIVTVCPQRNWSILAPAFVHEIESVDHGSN
jgi:hypothetical protein